MFDGALLPISKFEKITFTSTYGMESFHVTDPYYSVPLRAYNYVCLCCLMTMRKTIV